MWPRVRPLICPPTPVDDHNPRMISIKQVVADNTEPFVVADQGGTRIIVMNRPEARNALSRQMRRDFPALIAAAEGDNSISVVILTGMDPAFSSGVDLKERGVGPPIVPNPGEVLRAAHKPVIAAVNGACVTGALEMALSCSFIIASPQARFADTHAKVGMFPRWGQTALLPSVIGSRRAMQMMLTGEFVGAEVALEWGIVNEIRSSDSLLDRCLEIASQIGAANRESVLAHMQALRAVDADSLRAGLEVERLALEGWDRLRR
jgi:enoyl-CoA hydratase